MQEDLVSQQNLSKLSETNLDFPAKFAEIAKEPLTRIWTVAQQFVSHYATIIGSQLSIWIFIWYLPRVNNLPCFPTYSRIVFRQKTPHFSNK